VAKSSYRSTCRPLRRHARKGTHRVQDPPGTRSMSANSNVRPLCSRRQFVKDVSAGLGLRRAARHARARRAHRPRRDVRRRHGPERPGRVSSRKKNVRKTANAAKSTPVATSTPQCWPRLRNLGVKKHRRLPPRAQKTRSIGRPIRGLYHWHEPPTLAMSAGKHVYLEKNRLWATTRGKASCSGEAQSKHGRPSRVQMGTQKRSGTALFDRGPAGGAREGSSERPYQARAW